MLGVSESAVRKRLSRGTLTHEKRADGRVYILLDEVVDVSATHESNTLTSELKDRIGFLEDEIGFLRQQLERKDAILMTMAQRIPELEAPPEAREAPETESDSDSNTRVPEEERRPWWRRMFGG
jgi:hypothetical protein